MFRFEEKQCFVARFRYASGEFTRHEVGVGAITLTADAPHLSSSPLFERGARVQVGLDPAELWVLA